MLQSPRTTLLALVVVHGLC